MATITESPSRGDFGELKALVREAGLLEKCPTPYVVNTVVGLLVLGAAVVLIFVLRNSWLVLLDAVFFAVASVQVAFIVHDAGHREIARSGKANDRLGLFLLDLMLGVSYGWWTDKHNRHHSHPNDIDLDPDLNIPVLAFSVEQAVRSPRVFRPIIRYQAFILPFFLCFEAIAMRVLSVRFLLFKGGRYRVPEIVLIAINYTAYLVLLFGLLGPEKAIGFIVVHHAVAGLYLAMSFAPNHKGMPTLTDATRPDFLRMQVITSRNLTGNSASDFVFGSLSCQIEHHLFPSVSRYRLRGVQRIVRPFCEEHGIPYYETGFFRSWWEILTYMHEVGAPLRQG